MQLRRKLRRGELIPFFEGQPRCTVVMEACGAAHHWARVLGGLDHRVKLIAPEAVRPFVKRGKKNDAADAAAICTAASRLDARFVPVKSLEQQGVLALHSARALLVKQQTMLANAMRGLATEFGLVVPKGMGRLEELVALVEEDETFPEQARGVFAGLLEQCRATAERIAALEAEIVAHARGDGMARRLATVPCIGPITASLIAATVGGNIGAFRSARHFAAPRRSPDLRPCGNGSSAAALDGSGWCRGNARPAARPASAGSPRRATGRSGPCWCSARRRWCTGPCSGTAPPGRGPAGCWRGGPSGWRR